MSHPGQAALRNHLLATLQADSFGALCPFLEPVDLPFRKAIIEAGEPISHAYFPESGYASVVAGANGNAIEVGMIGREGMVGVSLVLGCDRMPFDVFIQLAGYGLRIEADRLRTLADADPPLRLHLLRYAHAFTVQVASTAFTNAEHTLEMRLARWLLMCHDRAGADEFAITHELLSVMLGVRRAGVTTALHVLEGIRAIRSRRGSITVLSREKLERLADGGYAIAEREYARLFGPLSDQRGSTVTNLFRRGPDPS